MVRASRCEVAQVVSLIVTKNGGIKGEVRRFVCLSARTKHTRRMGVFESINIIGFFDKRSFKLYIAFNFNLKELKT